MYYCHQYFRLPLQRPHTINAKILLISDSLPCNQAIRKNKVITIMLLTMKYDAGELNRVRERASSVMHA